MDSLQATTPPEMKNASATIYNIKRLRKVVAVILLFVTASVWVMAWLDDTTAILLGALPVLMMGIVAGLIIANTWCKKK